MGNRVKVIVWKGFHRLPRPFATVRLAGKRNPTVSDRFLCFSDQMKSNRFANGVFAMKRSRATTGPETHKTIARSVRAEIRRPS